MILKLTKLLLVTLPCVAGCDNQPNQPINENGALVNTESGKAYLHPNSGLAFPANIGEFSRGDIEELNDGEGVMVQYSSGSMLSRKIQADTIIYPWFPLNTDPASIEPANYEEYLASELDKFLDYNMGKESPVWPLERQDIEFKQVGNEIKAKKGCYETTSGPPIDRRYKHCFTIFLRGIWGFSFKTSYVKNEGEVAEEKLQEFLSIWDTSVLDRARPDES